MSNSLRLDDLFPDDSNNSDKEVLRPWIVTLPEQEVVIIMAQTAIDALLDQPLGSSVFIGTPDNYWTATLGEPESDTN